MKRGMVCAEVMEGSALCLEGREQEKEWQETRLETWECTRSYSSITLAEGFGHYLEGSREPGKAGKPMSDQTASLGHIGENG